MKIKTGLEWQIQRFRGYFNLGGCCCRRYVIRGAVWCAAWLLSLDQLFPWVDDPFPVWLGVFRGLVSVPVFRVSVSGAGLLRVSFIRALRGLIRVFWCAVVYLYGYAV